MAVPLAGRGRRVLSLLGFEVRVDASWLILAALVAWSLAGGLFPAQYPGFSRGVYWAMGIAATLGLFGSIVIHELFHALMARRDKIPMRGITLFIFGGVAEMDAEPPSARVEARMAAAGPAVSIVIALLLLGITAVAAGALPLPVAGVIGYLGWLNLLLAGFNLIPAYPLDGGRLLRAWLWHRRGDVASATRTAARAGTIFAFVLMTLGVLAFVGGAIIAGIWWFVLGLFLRGLAQGSYRQVVYRRALAGEPVSRFMRSDPVTVTPALTLTDLVEDYVYRHHHRLFPVVEDDRLAGCITVDRVRNVPRDMWPHRRVGDVAAACSPENTIAPDTDALDALRLMHRSGRSRLLVASGDRLAGVLTLKDLMDFLALKLELEGETPSPRADGA